MPDLDGFEATRRLRQDPVTSMIPVIAVTASALGDAPKAARAAGCVDYIAKPIRAQTLFAALQTHLGARFIARAQPPAVSAGPEVNPQQRLVIAAAIREAAEVGDVSAIDAVVAQLGSGAPETALVRRIQPLAAAFDFDALRALSAELAAEAHHAGA